MFSEWIIAEIGAIFAGGVAAGIYPSDTPDQVTFKARHSGAAVAVVEGAGKAQLFISKKSELPALKAVVVYGEDWENADDSERAETMKMAKKAVSHTKPHGKTQSHERCSTIPPDHLSCD